MIYFTDRFFNTVAIAKTETESGLRLINDQLNMSIESGTSLYSAEIEKSFDTVEQIQVGYYVFIPNKRGHHVLLEIMEMEETRASKTIIAEDAGLDLLNEDTGDLKFKGTLAEFIKKVIGTDSGWEIGLDEIQNEHNLTLEYEGITNQTKRINQIAGRFGAEISFSFDFDGNELKHKYINFHKERGKDVGRRLVIGKELKNVNRNISITDLCTAIRPIGEPHKEIIKTPKQVTETVTETKPGVLVVHQKQKRILKSLNLFNGLNLVVVKYDILWALGMALIHTTVQVPCIMLRNMQGSFLPIIE